MNLEPLNNFLKWLTLILDRLEVRAIVVGYTLLIILLGSGITRVTGLYGATPPFTALYWISYEYSIGMLLLLWQGNRLLWQFERRLERRFTTPFFKPLFFGCALAGFTAPASFVFSVGWFFVAELPIHYDTIQRLIVWDLLAISFLTFYYETTVFAREREQNLLSIEQLHRAAIHAELEALKLQLDPHFIFNSLNTLSHLIETRPAEALEFNCHLAEVYRYVLTHRQKTLVPLNDELSLLESYYTLLRLRFYGGIQLVVQSSIKSLEYYIMPLALQLLLENAVKHNEFDERAPLVITVDINCDYVSMSNPRRPKRVLKTPQHQSSGQGLENLNERARLITRQRIAIVQTDTTFFVRIPVVHLNELSS